MWWSTREKKTKRLVRQEIRHKNKRRKSLRWSPGDLTVLLFPDEPEARPSDQRYTPDDSLVMLPRDQVVAIDIRTMANTHVKRLECKINFFAILLSVLRPALRPRQYRAQVSTNVSVRPCPTIPIPSFPSKTSLFSRLSPTLLPRALLPPPLKVPTCWAGDLSIPTFGPASSVAPAPRPSSKFTLKTWTTALPTLQVGTPPSSTPTLSPTAPPPPTPPSPKSLAGSPSTRLTTPLPLPPYSSRTNFIPSTPLPPLSPPSVRCSPVARPSLPARTAGFPLHRPELSPLALYRLLHAPPPISPSILFSY
jgi:hypothetical protein